MSVCLSRCLVLSLCHCLSPPRRSMSSLSFLSLLMSCNFRLSVIISTPPTLALWICHSLFFPPSDSLCEWVSSFVSRSLCLFVPVLYSRCQSLSLSFFSPVSCFIRLLLAHYYQTSPVYSVNWYNPNINSVHLSCYKKVS